MTRSSIGRRAPSFDKHLFCLLWFIHCGNIKIHDREKQGFVHLIPRSQSGSFHRSLQCFLQNLRPRNQMDQKNIENKKLLKTNRQHLVSRGHGFVTEI